jgi:TusA-related sulfurtransferase
MKRGDELEIEIDETGAVRVVTHNVKGKRCLEYMEIFQALLGAPQEKSLKPEFNEVEVSGQTQAQVETHVRRL